MISDPISLTARFHTAEEFAHHHIRERILSGELAGGTKLHQDELAALLGISRMPIRQAIRRLESEGLVTSRPNRGAVVTVLGPQAILELFEMRSVLEGLAFRIATSHVTAKEIAEVRKRIHAMDQVQDCVSAWAELHEELHDYLCDCSGRSRLIANVRQLRQAVLPYIRLYLSTHESAEMRGFEHETLLRALEARRPEVSEQIMREHVMSAAMGVVEFVQSQTAS